MPTISYRGYLVPFAIPQTDKYGQPFQEWDGSTLDGGLNPCNYEYPDTTPAYGDGSLYCLKLNKSQVAELYWRAREIVTTATVSTQPLVTAGSSSSTGDYQDGNNGPWKTASSSGSVTPAALSSFYAVSATCNYFNDYEGFCDNATLTKSTIPMSSIYLRAIEDNGDIDESRLVIPHPYSQPYRISDNSVQPDPYFASFIDSNLCNKYFGDAASAGSFYIIPNLPDFLYGYQSGGSNWGSDMGIIVFDPYWPTWDILQTGEDEFWWAPKVTFSNDCTCYATVETFNRDALRYFGAQVAISSSIIVSSATGNRRLSDTLGANITTIPVSITFSDGTTVSGNQFIIQQVVCSSMNYTNQTGYLMNTQTASASGEATDPSRRATVSLTINPAVLLPTSVSLSFNKYWSYDGFYNEATGHPASL